MAVAPVPAAAPAPAHPRRAIEWAPTRKLAGRERRPNRFSIVKTNLFSDSHSGYSAWPERRRLSRTPRALRGPGRSRQASGLGWAGYPEWQSRPGQTDSGLKLVDPSGGHYAFFFNRVFHTGGGRAGLARPARPAKPARPAWLACFGNAGGRRAWASGSPQLRAARAWPGGRRPSAMAARLGDQPTISQL